MIYIDETMLQRQGSQISNDVLEVRYFKEFGRNAYYDDSTVVYETAAEFEARFNSYFDKNSPFIRQNTSLIDDIETKIPATSDRKLPNGDVVLKVGSDNWIYDLTNVSKLVCLFTLYSENCLSSK